MSKVTKRKITVDSPSNKLSSCNSLLNKDSQRRQSVFERLGTKAISINTASGGLQQSSCESFCRHWNQNGTCPYGKSCVFVNTHVLISPSKRGLKKDLDPKQLLTRNIEEGLKIEGLKRLHSTVVKRGSPDLNWESWDQTDLEYEDEKVLEKRLQLLQRELELQMKQEESEEHHLKKHSSSKQKKGQSSSSSTSLSSSSSESSSSSDDSSSDTSSTSGIAGDKKKKNKLKSIKRGSASSQSDTERKKVRNSSKSMHKDRSPSNISKKSTSSRDKRAFTPPKKPSLGTKLPTRKKSASPSHRRHVTPTNSSKSKPSTSKSSGGSRHNQSPRPSKRSTSLERRDKHKRSLSPRPRAGAKDTRPRRKDSPDLRPRNTTRNDDRKKEDDRSRNKDDRRQDRKPASDRDKRDLDDVRARDKAREAAREKEREEALERCRERQREREQLAKDKERARERSRDDRDKDGAKQRDYDKPIPPLMTVSIHNQPDRKLTTDRDRERSNKDRKDKDKVREREKDRDRLYDRNLDKLDRNRPLEKDRLTEKLIDRVEKDRPRERENINDRSRDKTDRDKNFERDRNFDRNVGEPPDRAFERDRDRSIKGLDRNKERELEREKDRNFDRITDNRRPFEKAVERERVSLEKDRAIVRDRGIDRVLELRERNKSLDRGRASDGERSVDRNRERYDRDGRFDKRNITAEDKGFESPYDSRRERPRYSGEGSDRSIFKDHSPPRDDTRVIRHPQGFNEDRRRGGRGWEQRGGYEETKGREWDYPDTRRDWEARGRHGEWEGSVEGAEEWGRYNGGGEWGGDWRDDWQHRPPRHQPRDDQTVVPSNHIIVRDTNNDDPGGRRQVLDPSDKGLSNSIDFKKEGADIVLESGGHKRARDGSDLPTETKKPRLEEPLPSANLEEALSDISDDVDEILNREDIDVTPQDSMMLEEDVRPSVGLCQPSTNELDQRLLEDRPSEEENIDNLDFEEISDEELEEEARANKGLVDALGVDWASLVTESRPRPAIVEAGAARRRWQPDKILARIGVSMQYAGTQLYNQIQQKLSDNKAEEDNNELLHPVAALHVALRDRQARRRALFSGTDVFKRALSARADIAIRRQLCNLPVTSLQMQQAAGFCQLVV